MINNKQIIYKILFFIQLIIIIKMFDFISFINNKKAVNK